MADSRRARLHPLSLVGLLLLLVLVMLPAWPTTGQSPQAQRPQPVGPSAAPQNASGLAITIIGPQGATVGSPVKFQVHVANVSNRSLDKVVVIAQPDAMLRHESGSTSLNLTVGKLAKGESRTVPLVLTPQNVGKMSVRVSTKDDPAGAR